MEQHLAALLKKKSMLRLTTRPTTTGSLWRSTYELGVALLLQERIAQGCKSPYYVACGLSGQFTRQPACPAFHPVRAHLQGSTPEVFQDGDTILQIRRETQRPVNLNLLRCKKHIDPSFEQSGPLQLPQLVLALEHPHLDPANTSRGTRGMCSACLIRNPSSVSIH